jgi:hypothetical protein
MGGAAMRIGSMRISRTWIVLWSGLALGGAISIAATSSGNSGNSSTAHESYSERYSIVTDNNIFMRDRHRRSGRYEPTTSTATTRPLEESLVLTGIVIEDQGLRAYVENTDTHSVMRLSPGDAIGHGKVDSIQIDAFDYLHNGEHSWIDVGSDLTGHAATLPDTSSSYEASSGSSSSSTQPSGPPIDPNDPNLTLEQKMKLRRQQLLGHS